MLSTTRYVFSAVQVLAWLVSIVQATKIVKACCVVHAHELDATEQSFFEHVVIEL